MPDSPAIQAINAQLNETRIALDTLFAQRRALQRQIDALMTSQRALWRERRALRLRELKHAARDLQASRVQREHHTHDLPVHQQPRQHAASGQD